jgi:hypothetical protein
MPNGLSLLLSYFKEIEIVPEGYSIAGLLRLINLFFDTFVEGERIRRLIKLTVFPAANLAGITLDRFSRLKSEFTTNYSCRARKNRELRMC